MSSGDLDINSIDRFRKTSDRLVLEQHGSCEVPAGCGGVVLRWHNPDAGLPVVFSCAVAGQIDLFVNGQAIASRATLPFGENTIAIRLSDVDVGLPFLMATRRDVPASDRQDSDDEELVIREGCSRTDGTWLCSDEPAESDMWINPGFDDSGWHPLLNLNNSLPEENRWRFEVVLRSGGQPLQLPASADSLLIRTKMTIEKGDR